MSIVIKTIKGRGYYYDQRSYRVGGKVRTKSIYLGPVGGPKRKKRGGGFPPINPAAIVLNALALAMHIAGYGTRPPNYKTKQRAPDPRTRAHMLDAERARWERRIEDANGGWAPAREKPAPSEEWQAFMDRIKARETRQDASERAKAAKARDTTIDDERDARQAKFHATQEEVNASRGYDPAPAEPPDDFAPASDDAGPSGSGTGGSAGPGSDSQKE